MEQTISKVSHILRICTKFLLLSFMVLTLTSFKPFDPKTDCRKQNVQVKAGEAFTVDKTPKQRCP